MTSYYDVYFDVAKEFREVKASSPEEALLSVIDKLKDAIQEKAKNKLTKGVCDHWVDYFYNENVEDSYDDFKLSVIDLLDFSEVDGQSEDVLKWYDDFFHHDKPELRPLTTHDYCGCCRKIMHRDNLYGWSDDKEGAKNPSWDEKVKELGLDEKYLDFFTMCKDCLNDKKYLTANFDEGE